MHRDIPYEFTDEAEQSMTGERIIEKLEWCASIREKRIRGTGKLSVKRLTLQAEIEAFRCAIDIVKAETER